MSGKLSAIFTSDPGQKKVPDFSPWDFAVCQISKNKEDVWAWLKHAQRWFWSFFLTTFIRVDIIVIKVTCSVSFYKMQCFYAAALTLNECALCPFSEAACQSGIFIIKTMLTILNQQSHTSFFHIIQLLHAAMQSRNVQVPGDFSLGETVRSKKAQNKTKQSKTKNFIWHFCIRLHWQKWSQPVRSSLSSHLL